MAMQTLLGRVPIVIALLWIGLFSGSAHAQGQTQAPAARVASGAPEGRACIQCHAAQNPALTEEWRLSAHGEHGINCYDCHRATKDNP
jgi:hypothetical protein